MLDQAKGLKKLERESTKLKRLAAELFLEKQILKDVAGRRLLRPERRRDAVSHACESCQVTEQYACPLLGLWRGTQRSKG